MRPSVTHPFLLLNPVFLAWSDPEAINRSWERERNMDLFVRNPWIALPIAAAFLIAWVVAKGSRDSARNSPGWSLAATIAWTAYWAYEQFVARRQWNIRIDLWLIYSLLILLSVLALVSLRSQRHQ